MSKAVVLARHPSGPVREDDFEVVSASGAALADGSFRLENRVISLDAGFRQWMNEGAGDNYLSGMRIGDPVQALVLGRVSESRHPGFPVGALVSARTAWEEQSVLDGSDLCSVIDPMPGVPEHEFLSVLGPTGMTAWIGLMDIGQPQPGEWVVVSAAAGAVGTVVGQLARERGCHTVGLTSTSEKARWLCDEVGYMHAIAREAEPDLATALRNRIPEGVDVFFDNVGGATLDTIMGYLRERARLVLCGAISQYESEAAEPVTRSWELITKRARAEGFMFSDHTERFPGILTELQRRLGTGSLRSFDSRYHGIEAVPRAFCDMMHGKTRGKCLVLLGGD